jgi:hypothetical protein
MGDGGYTLNAWSSGKPENSLFAVVIVRSEGNGEASWNADPDDSKAMDTLGAVTFEEGCWVNKRTKICARCPPNFSVRCCNDQSTRRVGAAEKRGMKLYTSVFLNAESRRRASSLAVSHHISAMFLAKLSDLARVVGGPTQGE